MSQNHDCAAADGYQQKQYAREDYQQCARPADLGFEPFGGVIPVVTAQEKIRIFVKMFEKESERELANDHECARIGQRTHYRHGEDIHELQPKPCQKDGYEKGRDTDPAVDKEVGKGCAM